MFFTLIFAAVRYGRVPKRTREINNSSNVISTTSSCINISSSCSSSSNSSNNNNNSKSSNCTNVIVGASSPKSLDDLSSIDSSKIGSSEPNTPQMCPVATPPDVALVLSPGNSTTSNNGHHHELTVYDVILCVSQAHHTYCTYTDEHIRGLKRCPITLPISEKKEDNNVS